MRPFFITGTGTDIGKTVVTTSLCWQLRRLGKTVTALKPVISGFAPDDMDSDTALILKSCGLSPELALMKSISPWRYTAALTPSMAAALENKTLDAQEVIAYCRDHAQQVTSDVLLVEGAGGVMSPLSDTTTMLDWMEALGWPVILVTGSYLGTLSHTLTAMESLRARRLFVKAVVLSESEKSAVPLADTASALEKFLPEPVPVVKLARLRGRAPLWEEAPLISWLCNE